MVVRISVVLCLWCTFLIASPANISTDIRMLEMRRKGVEYLISKQPEHAKILALKLKETPVNDTVYHQWPFEKWFYGFLTQDYEFMTNFYSFYDELKRVINMDDIPLLDQEYEALFDITYRSHNDVMVALSDASLTYEQRSFLVILYDYVLRKSLIVRMKKSGSYHEYRLLEKKYKRLFPSDVTTKFRQNVTAFLKRYPYSIYSEFLKKEVFSEASFGIGVLTGGFAPNKDLADLINGGNIFPRVEGYFSKNRNVLNLSLLQSFGHTFNVPEVDGKLIEFNGQYRMTQLSVEAGYRLFRYGKYTVTPFIGGNYSKVEGTALVGGGFSGGVIVDYLLFSDPYDYMFMLPQDDVIRMKFSIVNTGWKNIHTEADGVFFNFSVGYLFKSSDYNL